ncbi:hypothetical protein P3342_007577 [Pyrenophora teres f. teres]|nr:hypothetical protein P3342_007577 [Pyrenophora teres f. teres]
MEDPYSDDDEGFDEYQRWRAFEPKWTKPMLEGSSNNPIKYWVALQPKYPSLASFAINILTIPASSCECERVFSEVGDLLTLGVAKSAHNSLPRFSVYVHGGVQVLRLQEPSLKLNSTTSSLISYTSLRGGNRTTMAILKAN